MIVAGFGFRKMATKDSLLSALARASGGQEIALLAVPEDKATASCLQELAGSTGLAVKGVPATELEAVTTPTLSPHSRTHRNTGSVAEAAALAAAGPGARLAGPRKISNDRMATCAVAIKDPS